MQRRAVNPWDWSLKLGYNQAEVIEGPRRQLICAGQTAVDGQGKPQHPNDMRAQIALALDNLEAVLAGADMSLGDVLCHGCGRGVEELRPAGHAFRAAKLRTADDASGGDAFGSSGFAL